MAKIPHRVVVPAVFIGKRRVQHVIFSHDRKKRAFVAHTPGCPDIQVVWKAEDKMFHAHVGIVDIPDKRADRAFGKAANRVWYA